jgi:sugar lactone lactonase YvrE
MRTTTDAPRRAVAAAALVIAATCVVGVTAAGNLAQAGPSFKKVGSWGKQGTGNGQFGSNAFGLATDKAGNVYVADSDNHRIQMFSSKGGFKKAFAFAQSESAQDVASGPDGSVWGTALQGSEARNFGGNADPLSTEGQAYGVAVDADGNVYVAAGTDNKYQVVRYDKTEAGLTKGKTFGGFKAVGDVETSADGSFYAVDGLNVKRFVGDRLAKTYKGGASAPLGIAVDLDCNLWMTNIAQRNLTKVSPTGKTLGTAASPDLIAQDVAVGPTGDLYAYDSGTHSVVRFAEDRSKPAAAAVAGTVTASKGLAKVKYTLSGIACPAQLSAVASLKGAVNGKATVKVSAGRSTVLSIPAKGTSGKAQFTIVLKTNGRPTTQTAAVSVTVK